MNNLMLMVVLLAVMTLAYHLGLTRSKKVASTNAGTQRLHSRPVYHGMLTLLWCAVPALLIWIMWSLSSPILIQQMVVDSLPTDLQPTATESTHVLMNKLHNIASGFAVLDSFSPQEITAADYLKQLEQRSYLLLTGLMATVAAAGLVFSTRQIRPDLRARNTVERALHILLILCSGVAILTTVGIVLSMVGEALRFFSFVSPSEFFFGTTWNPRFSTVGTENQTGFGMLPLLAGTFLIALIALIVAIPIGLMCAIYLAEYAPSRVRSIAKPIIEVLAGIPTIVYGFFALITVGPFLSELGQWLHIDIRATSALTAGIVMGLMVIPFISSLSDDILTQVPKTLRDGSLGLGATKSETIRKVVLPAALPGVTGAVLLAASRAIGETMIVVLAAGNSPVLTANPFEAVSTMTVTIVNQLTGDTDFASPQSLVAFALGLTLFVITLCLNVIALVIVRKYREQYE
ncbi:MULTISPECIES: phosphate ABC transporter permease subunit PstC [unclassified Vibrio]|uniref:phosphate ABC transporter permease subunit PstC n=1 Tax=unclassified Vibrio TaxID=2614977 RepID=UPI000B8E3F27|nr:MULTISPECIES: phosphate ABC transporter permease subunit PstC [unclassified Vibrio]NAW99283.1 phosphate ABC transporter permease subunit PstC [Vibrio sp. V23_P3S9T160]OXX44246.1 phosphate ABC transporter permease subunit PstC [Vibrio sp. V11_P1A41T118]